MSSDDWYTHTRWKARTNYYDNSTDVLGGDRADIERAINRALQLRQPWEEQPDYDDMPYRPPHRPPVTEWHDCMELDLLEELTGPARPPETDEQKEQDMVRMTRERMAILSALEDAGGSINDPSGRATTRLAELMGRDASLRSLTGTLARMEEEGLVVREVNGRRTLRIALPNADTFTELADALRTLDGKVEGNGADAATLLRDVMQWGGSKKAFRDLLSRADREGVIRVDRTGNKINGITLLEAVAPATVEIDPTDPEEVAFEEALEQFQSSPAPADVVDTPAMPETTDEMQRLAFYLLDEVVQRATVPIGLPEDVVSARVQEAIGPIQAEHDKAVQVAIDRMNQLDVAQATIKELQTKVRELEIQLRNSKLELDGVEKELKRRPLGPKVDEILRPDSAEKLEQFKRLMSEKPRNK